MAGRVDTALVGARAESFTRQTAAVAGVSLLAAVLYSAVSLALQATMRTGVDLTIFTQAVQAYSRLEVPNVLVKAQEPSNILGDHFSPIIALLGVGYRLWPDTRSLLVAQALLMALGVFLLGRFAVARLGWWGVLICFAFASSWGILDAIAFDFHEIAFAVPLLVIAIWSLLVRKDAWLVGACAALLLVKEDSAFLVAGIAICLIASKRFRMGAALGVGSVAYFLVVVYGVIPALSSSGRYVYLKHLESGPVGNLVSNVTSPDVIVYLVVLALTCGIGLTSPVALVMLPTILARLVTDDPAYVNFGNHYHATLMAVCFMALTDGLVRLRRSGSTRSPAVLIVQSAAAVVIAITSWLTSTGPPILASAAAPCSRCEDLRALASDIPLGAKVVADVYLMPQLVDHYRVMLAVPAWTDSTDAPLDATWVLVDLSVHAGDGPKGWEAAKMDELLARGEYSLVEHRGDFALLEKSP